MTRKQFEKAAIRAAERALKVPAGWWGTWQHVCGPNGAEVRFARGGHWVLRHKGKIVSKHDSRAFAIVKGRKL